MTRVRRVEAVCASMALLAYFTSLHAWGEASRATNGVVGSGSQSAPDDASRSLAEDLAQSKFARGGVLTYNTQHGDTLFALGLQPRLDPAPARSRDYLVLVDTSASQVGGPLRTAQSLAEELIARAQPDDRLDLWTVNTPAATRDLTKGFQPANRARDALKALKDEVPLGDTDLKNGLEQALKSFGGEADRQRVLVFLGDGMSTHNPLSPEDRSRLCKDMVSNQITLFPVPLGPQLDTHNLDGLASGTGGRVVRTVARDKVVDLLNRLQEAMAAPVLYPTGFQLPAEVTGAFPTQLPPLRPDAPTLVIGHIKPGPNLAYTIRGTVAGRDVQVQVSEPVTEPEVDNFFLAGMYDQWSRAKDTPAFMPADRALAYAFQLNQVARQELLSQGQLALAGDNLEAAGKLFEQAKNLDPHDVEAQGGLKLVEMMRDGKVTKDQLRKQLARTDGQAVRFDKDARDPSGKVQVRHDQMKNLLASLAPQEAPAAAPAAPGAPEPVAPPVDVTNPLRQQEARIAIADQRATQTVDDSLRQARSLLAADPDGAHDLVKRVLSGMRDDPDLSDRTRRNLVNRLESALRDIDAQGALIKRDQSERLERVAIARARFEDDAKRVATEERTRERMRVFHSLMDQARYSDAYKQALAIAQDAVEQGAPVPVAVTGAYDIGIVASNLRTLQEFRRVREERYVLTMLEVERSFVPFPDEPPIWFPEPPFSKVDWRKITQYRKERYESSGLLDDDPTVLRKVKDLQKKLERPVNLDFSGGISLREALEYITDRYDLPLIIDTNAFKVADPTVEVESQTVKTKLKGVSLATALRLMLAQVGGTYLIRRDYVEVTTPQFAVAEKTIRVFPVADLVIPIPNGVNNMSLMQNFQLLGQTATVGGNGVAGVIGFGGGVIGLNALGGGLALGALGGALGGGLGALGAGLGAGVLGNGGGGALGVAGGGIGGAGGGFGGNGGGFAGGGVQNNGVGGGFSGFGGGQLGQFGNLGGQFGIQGGDQSAILIKLITQVVGSPTDWLPPNQFNNGGVGGPLGDPNDPSQNANPAEANTIGYYPAARALLVKAPSRLHTSLSGGLTQPKGPGAAPVPGGMGALDVPKEGAIVILPHDPNRPKRTAVAAADDHKGEGDVKAPKSAVAAADLDARRIWQDALAKGVRDPGLIIATADFLAEHGKFDHAAEFLKADLRQGIVVEPWVYEALTVALKESQGSPADIERAQLSAVDLQPQNAGSYLQASQAMADHKMYDRALAFCKQASQLEPNLARSYEEAIDYAELGEDTGAMEWAAGNLLKRDWPRDNDELHGKAQEKLKSLEGVLEKKNRQAEAQQMAEAVRRDSERDLVLQLSWGGEADLDLEVKEPVGTVCSFLNRQTPGGGTLMGDSLADMQHEAYVAAEAFPGTYEVTVRKVWGRPLGSKATLKIIQHQGTPQETFHQETVVIDDLAPRVTVTLGNGRRTSLAKVPPPGANQRPAAPVDKLPTGNDILAKLRGIADHDVSTTRPVSGGVATSGTPDPSRFDPAAYSARPGDQVALQGTVSPFLTNGLDYTLQGTVSSDRRFLKLSMSPVFQTLNNSEAGPTFTNPVIPGASSPNN